MEYLQWALWIAGIILLSLTISAMLRGGYRRFPLVFVYCVVSLLAIVVQIAAPKGPIAARYYWYSEQIEQLLVYCIVIVLIYRALGEESRGPVGRWLVMGAVAVAIISASVHRDERLLSLWMTKLSRDLNFTAAILDLILWTILLASHRRNRLLLMISGGLGMKFAGSAIGQSMRLLANRSPILILIGNLIVVLTFLACIYVWWMAFREPETDGPERLGRRDRRADRLRNASPP